MLSAIIPEGKPLTSLINHDWSKPRKTVFVVEACWYLGSSIVTAVCHVAESLSDAKEYFPIGNQLINESVFWWQITGRVVGDQSNEIKFGAIFSPRGDPLTSKPNTPMTYSSELSHITGCKICSWKYVGKVARLLQYDKSHPSDKYFEDFISSFIKPTGALFPSGVEILVEPRNRFLYVDSIGNITYTPGGSQLPTGSITAHW
jgi:hypothetical protein